MTDEKALYELKRRLPAKVSGNGLYCDAYDVAIKALEKQIPEKPREYGASYNCPKCSHTVGMKDRFYPKTKETFCNECGQAIDWSDV